MQQLIPLYSMNEFHRPCSKHYIQKSQMYKKAESFIRATLPLTSIYIEGVLGDPRAIGGMDSIPCSASSGR